MNKIEIQNKVIICCDCGEKFIWEKGEQLFYEQRGFLPPRLCSDCRRELKRKRREDERRSEEVQHGK
ncbi:zinc-ribbon domain containing protein [Chloroflexota bacterium]